MRSDKQNLITYFGIVITILIFCVIAIFIFGKEIKTEKNPIVTMETSEGIIKLELYKNETPKTVENFVGLSEKGYYNGLTFHRAMKDFVIQGGDPKGDGSGGESFFGKPFEDEIFKYTDSYKKGYVKGIIAMANSGANSNNSQFFITVGDLNSTLPKNYTIFGKVIEGQDVADKISTAEVVDNGNGEVSKPVNPVTITKVTVEK
ncbi:MAG: peptidylprolyl isomerase [bacterium]